MARRHTVLVLAVCAAAVALALLPPVAQPPEYHNFADQRAFFGIRNFLDVTSNLPFAVVGILGLSATFSGNARRPAVFADPWERWPWAVLFAGVTLTALGSSYYHLAPDNWRLVWDRIPITVGFMGLLSAVIAERISLTLARRLLLPVLLLGAASVAYWYWGELRGSGDMRLYILVQFGAILVVLLQLALFPPRYSEGGHFFGAIAMYGVAKGFEVADARIFAMGHIISGHALKHLAAAAGVALLIVMLRRRRLLPA